MIAGRLSWHSNTASAIACCAHGGPLGRCPYWSKKVLCLTPEDRALLFMGASFAAIRLQRLIDPYVKRLGTGSSLTPRELAALRLLSNGKRVREIASLLDLGEETVRSHIKKAQSKLVMPWRRQFVYG